MVLVTRLVKRKEAIVAELTAQVPESVDELLPRQAAAVVGVETFEEAFDVRANAGLALFLCVLQRGGVRERGKVAELCQGEGNRLCGALARAECRGCETPRHRVGPAGSPLFA